jgi:hypothetical protein
VREDQETLPRSPVPSEFPESLLREIKIPKNLSGPFTDKERRAIFLSSLRSRGRSFADEMVNIDDTERDVLDSAIGILTGRQDRHAVEVLLANYANRLAEIMVNDMRGRFRTERIRQEDTPEVARRRFVTYASLWREIAKRG